MERVSVGSVSTYVGEETDYVQCIAICYMYMKIVWHMVVFGLVHHLVSYRSATLKSPSVNAIWTFALPCVYPSNCLAL